MRARAALLASAVLALSGCFTSRLSWNDEGSAPRLRSPSEHRAEWELSYHRESAVPVEFFALSAAQLEPFLYRGEPTTAAVLREARDPAATETRLAALRALPSREDWGLIEVRPPLWIEHNEGCTVLAFLKPAAAEALAAAWREHLATLPAAEREQKEHASLREMDFPPAERIAAALDAGQLPAEVEVFLAPSVVPLTGGEVAGNVGTVLIAPFAVLLDVVTFPFQAVYFLVINDEAIWIGGAGPR